MTCSKMGMRKEEEEIKVIAKRSTDWLTSSTSTCVSYVSMLFSDIFGTVLMFMCVYCGVFLLCFGTVVSYCVTMFGNIVVVVAFVT